ncbi:hypothetical protein ABZS52_18620 [Micromonospora profundi]|uniref:hypothetical protein n=1 Tax=Micromonospora profundi TaxID=1420889 RepID=UPI0033A0B58A
MATIRKKLVHTAVIAALAAGALAGTSQPAAAAWKSCNLGAKVDELRGWDANGKYNIIVWKDSAYERANFEGVVLSGIEYAEACDDYSGSLSLYRWAVFKSGTFVRKGDGGYRNWAFFGRWTRPTDEKVVFKVR